MTLTDGFARGVAALAISIGAAGASSGQEPAPRTLHALTVPEARLPEGCGFGPKPTALREVDPVSGRVHISLGGDNGWPFVTTSPAQMAAIRHRIDPVSVRLPDAPPDAAEAARLRARWVEHVIDAYRASYLTRDGERVEVAAIRFDDASRVSRAAAWEVPQPSAAYRRIVRGAIVAVISARTRTPCFDAIDAHIRSLN